jgi:3-isopropylmalate/(R)-2-methylmalate dehydratase small subunit
MIITGKVWKCGDNVLESHIYPDKYRVYPIPDPERYKKEVMDASATSLQEMASHAMEDFDPSFSREALEGKYQIIVAGENFGRTGKYMEQPLVALRAAGIRLIIAKSINRYLYRNAINYGVPILLCRDMEKMVREGDTLSANLTTGQITNLTANQSAKATPLPELALRIVSKGGYIQYAHDASNDSNL